MQKTTRIQIVAAIAISFNALFFMSGCDSVSNTKQSLIAKQSDNFDNSEIFDNSKPDVTQLQRLKNSGFEQSGEPVGTQVQKDKVLVYRTSQSGDKDKYLQEIIPTSKDMALSEKIEIFPAKERQTMLGIGGSFTDSAVSNINKLNEENQQVLYDAYFGQYGSRYTVTRVTIGSADFSTKFYDYSHSPNLQDDDKGTASRENKIPDPGALLKDDKGNPAPDLKWFSIEGTDTQNIIPAIKRANSYLKKYPDFKQNYPNKRKELSVFAAPWSAPAWMKGGGVRPGGTALAGAWTALNVLAFGTIYKNHSVQKKYYPAYADYFVKYLQAMRQNGIDIYSISLNNEAQNHPAWENTLWHSSDAADFIANHLGPQMVKAKFKPENGKGGVKLLVWDWDRPDFGHADGFNKWNHDLLTNTKNKASKYVDGIAFHWYGGLGNAGTSWGRDYHLLDKFSKAPYNMEMYATEASQEGGAFLGEWFPARRYIYDMINTFENHTRTWIDWNLLLDKKGGPTHEVSNNLHAPIHIDFKDPKDKNDDEFIINPAYYVLKRMSLEVRPGSVNIETKSNLNKKDIFKTAFKQKDGSISLLVGNIPNDGKDNSKGKTYKFSVVYGDKSFDVEVPPNSFSVYKFKP